jgi:hypothetical protein
VPNFGTNLRAEYFSEMVSALELSFYVQVKPLNSSSARIECVRVWSLLTLTHSRIVTALKNLSLLVSVKLSLFFHSRDLNNNSEFHQYFWIGFWKTWRSGYVFEAGKTAVMLTKDILARKKNRQ